MGFGEQRWKNVTEDRSVFKMVQSIPRSQTEAASPAPALPFSSPGKKKRRPGAVKVSRLLAIFFCDISPELIGLNKYTVD